MKSGTYQSEDIQPQRGKRTRREASGRWEESVEGNVDEENDRARVSRARAIKRKNQNQENKKNKNKNLQRVRISLKRSLVRTYLGDCKWLMERGIGG